MEKSRIRLDKIGRRYPAQYNSFGEAVRTMGGYGLYFQWLRANPLKLFKIGRNDKCPCDSGKKWKKCCIDKAVDKNYG